MFCVFSFNILNADCLRWLRITVNCLLLAGGVMVLFMLVSGLEFG